MVMRRSSEDPDKTVRMPRRCYSYGEFYFPVFTLLLSVVICQFVRLIYDKLVAAAEIELTVISAFR